MAAATATGALIKQSKGSQEEVAIVDVTFAGDYEAGGTLLDYAPLQGMTTRQPDIVEPVVVGGFVGQYIYSTKKWLWRGQEPTAATAGIIALTEIAAATLPAAISGAAVRTVARWVR